MESTGFLHGAVWTANTDTPQVDSSDILSSPTHGLHREARMPIPRLTEAAHEVRQLSHHERSDHRGRPAGRRDR